MTNADIMQGKWKQMKGQVQAKWGKITNDDLDRIDGRSEQLEGILQERYGMAREQARKEIQALADEV